MTARSKERYWWAGEHPQPTKIYTDVTIQNVLTDDIYNALSFRNGDRVIILLKKKALDS